MPNPIQFRDLPRAPYSVRSQEDRRLEFGVGYLSGGDIGINALVIAPGASVDRLFYTPGLSSFTGFLLTTVSMFLQVHQRSQFVAMHRRSQTPQRVERTQDLSFSTVTEIEVP